ncbi:AAA family ATPase [Parabacteroides sp. OttesenSCG-928-N08]|nr:AAA family ATPase [Parabacteroides sp. OttesenSCG-928-N08]
MLKSLYIQNFRCLKEFQIKSLKQVNLITGKNNTGKSTLLEALAIYGSDRKLNHIIDMLKRRGEFYAKEDDIAPFENNIKSLSSLFSYRNIGYDDADGILIGESATNAIRLRFVKDETSFAQIDFNIHKGENNNETIPLDSSLYKRGYRVLKNHEPVLYVQTGNISSSFNGKLFDNIALSDREKYVIDALKIVEPQTERIAFVEDINGGRNAVIKLSSSNDIQPLQSMGDGINRILTIILALVNSDGYLLIDEFENGLHYSVQEKLWKIILSLAEKLNVQVFATTHSNDSIYSFEKALNTPDNTVEGKLIRLDNKDGKINEVEFLPDELKIAERENIEIR